MTGLSASAVETLVKAYNFARFRHVAEDKDRRSPEFCPQIPLCGARSSTSPTSLRRCETLLRKAGVDDRFDILAGNFLESVPISCA